MRLPSLARRRKVCPVSSQAVNQVSAKAGSLAQVGAGDGVDHRQGLHCCDEAGRGRGSGGSSVLGCQTCPDVALLIAVQVGGA